MPAWPTTIPVCQASYTEKRMDGSIRSDMETGPMKVRQRFTATPVFLSMNYLVNAAQVQDLDDFYRADLKHGSLEFDFTHPRTQAAVKARIMEPPEFNAQDGGLLYRAALQIEVLP